MRIPALAGVISTNKATSRLRTSSWLGDATPWGLAAAAVSAGVGAYSSSNAAKKGQSAATASLDEQKRQYDQNQQNQKPWMDAGTNALQNLTQLSGQFGKMPTAADVMGQPGYQFGMNQGTQAVQGGAAAHGGLYSGAAGEALTKFGNDYATTKYGDAFNQKQSAENAIWNRYAGLAGIGQSATNQVGAYGQNYANQVGNIHQNNASFQGAAGIAGANAISNGINQGASWWGNRQQGGSGGGGYDWGNVFGTQYGNGYGGYGNKQYGEGMGPMADGGPIQRDANGMPVLGSRSPLRTGGGGGLTANALLQLLVAQQPQQPQQQMMPSGIGSLQANPATDPQAILAARLRQVGAYAQGGPIEGPGGPRDDVIPIAASNGEHMFDEPSVTAAGGGDNAAGQAKLNRLRELLKGGR